MSDRDPVDREQRVEVVGEAGDCSSSPVASRNASSTSRVDSPRAYISVTNRSSTSVAVQEARQARAASAVNLSAGSASRSSSTTSRVTVSTSVETRVASR
jgi:hypothetical protein